MLCKKGNLNNFSKFTDKHKKQLSEGFLSKDNLKNFAKLTEKHLWRGIFLNKIADWKPKNVRGSHWRCSVKKYVLKKVAGVSEPAVHRSSTK